MGCAGSKLDDLQAVALCRERSHCLAEAIHLRYALADAHEAYLRSLRGVGDTLHHLFDRCDLLPPPSPVLSLPAQRKGDPMPPLSPSPSPPPPPAVAISSAVSPVHRHSRSHSGSHLHFRPSDSEYSDEDDGPLHSGHSSPLHHHLHHASMDNMAASGGHTTNINFATKGPAAPAVSYEQRPMSPEVVQVGEPSYYSYPYAVSNDNYYGNSYPPFAPYSGYGGMGGGFFGAYPPSPATALSQQAVTSSPSKPPPPPPSPPKASTWDFLNPFGAYENDYPSYTPSRSSKELRDEEGIPDLEEEESEVVKEAYDDQKSVAASSSTVNKEMHSGNVSAVTEEQPHYQTRSGCGGEYPGGPENEVHLVDRNVASDEIQKREPDEIVNHKVIPQSREVSEVVQDIKVLFERASDSCDEVSKMLEVGKCPYHRKKYEVVSSKMRSAIVLPLSLSYPTPSISKGSDSSAASGNGESVYLEFDDDMAMKSGNVSSTLLKLFIWERKLYEEVRAEEKLRVLYDQKRRRLKRLEERCAEARKVGPTEVLVRKLSTKIKVAIQVVDSISNRISKLRDEELWPQLVELIQGLVRMWKAMMECHKSQYHAIIESKNMDGIASNGKLNEAHMEVIKHLELSLLRWIDAFCSWFHAQRSFVRALNGWLLKCLLYEPEVTPDGVAPFSPGRLGAPPVFVICNQWSQAMDNTSDGEVVAAMQAFAASVLQLWDRQKLAERQRMMANRDMDRRLRSQEREEQMIHKAVDALNRKLVMASDPNGAPIYGRIVHKNTSSEENSLREELKRIFDAMERLAESSVKIYEDLCARNEEEWAGRENPRAS
ncbi:unnamed protein product [Spirodela intermedia]|uniref:Uncharacterized protein n=1 Tax=Spirodela intermedia TaxID=51605 RepID=A0A7I8IE49_SPIIN|nr:unnamed protein product [Spirodela intermedia]CAA6656077.1 unnamed protein product [Spirodela intermedia]